MANGKQRNGRRNAKRQNALPPSLSKLTPQQIACIAGLLSNALSVDSVLIDKDQRLQIVLGGSLKRKTKLDEIINELSTMNVQEVINALISR